MLRILPLIVALLGLLANHAALDAPTLRQTARAHAIERVLRPMLCSRGTVRLRVYEDASYRCIGGRIILDIDNGR